MILDEIRGQLTQGLFAVDFSAAFPSGYIGAKAVTFVHAESFDLLDNLLVETDGQMTRPVISIAEVDVADVHRSLGNIASVGAPAGLTRHATRVEASYLISSWADQRLGGADTVELLGGTIVGWAFINQNALAAFRQLRASVSRGAYRVREQMWRYDVTLQGYALLTYDA